MKRTRKWIICALLCVSLLMAAGCGGNTNQGGGDSANSGDTASGNTGSAVQVGMSFHSMQNDVFVFSEQYLEQFGSEADPNVKFEFVVADDDVSKQTADVNDLISKKPNVIAICPQDSRAVESSIKAAHDAGMPVVVFNRPVNPDVAEQPDCFVGIDSTDQGYAVAKEIFAQMKADGIEDIKVVAISGLLTDENSVNRSNGLAAAAEECGATIVADIPCDWDPELAAANLPAALQANPDVNCVFVSSDGMLPGVESALADAGRWAPYGEENHMYLATCDCFEIGMTLMEEGYVDADALFDIVNQCKKTIEVINTLAAGGTVEPQILVEAPVYTRENMNDEAMKALLWQ